MKKLFLSFQPQLMLALHVTIRSLTATVNLSRRRACFHARLANKRELPLENFRWRRPRRGASLSSDVAVLQVAKWPECALERPTGYREVEIHNLASAMCLPSESWRLASPSRYRCSHIYFPRPSLLFESVGSDGCDTSSAVEASTL